MKKILFIAVLMLVISGCVRTAAYHEEFSAPSQKSNYTSKGQESNEFHYKGKSYIIKEIDGKKIAFKKENK